MIAGCSSHLRFVMVPTAEGFASRPVGLDYTPAMLVGAARGVDVAMLAEILPSIEAAILTADASETPDVALGDDPA